VNAFLCIEEWSVEKLIPYDRNARTHSDEQIAYSMQEFGLTNPILVDNTWCQSEQRRTAFFPDFRPHRKLARDEVSDRVTHVRAPRI
jgi:hypothetical protein